MKEQKIMSGFESCWEDLYTLCGRIVLCRANW